MSTSLSNHVAAGKTTKTNKLGYVVALPISFFLANVNAFELGARSVNPKAETRVVFTGTFMDPAKEATAASALLEQGVDVLGVIVDSPIAVVQTAEKRNAYSVGYHYIGVQKFALVIIMSWLALRLIEVSSQLIRRSLLRRHEPPSQPVIDFIQRGLKITVSVLAVLMMLEAVGVQVSALVAAIGVGGIGVALAAQRTVENLFGGLAVVGDRPVQEGDFCRFGNQQGTVERIGLWSTRLRTPERSVITVPNAQFLTLLVENLQERDRMLFNTTLRLRYETSPDQLRWVLVTIRSLLDAHPRVDPDSSRARFIGFGASSLDVELFVYVRTRDNAEFLGVREDLCLRIMDIVAAAGTAFALPAQTNYRAGDGLDAERAGAAAAEIRRLRSEGKLPLPEFPLKNGS